MNDKANNSDYERFKLVSIDSWNDGEGWYWNQHYELEDGIYFHTDKLTTRNILKSLRKWGYLTNESKGRVRIDDCDGVCYTVEDRNTGEQLLALTQLH